MLWVYLWLRFDPILRLTFRNDWAPRYEFMASIFGEKNAEDFLAHRVKLVKARNKILPPIIHSQTIEREVNLFLSTKTSTKIGRLKRISIINRLIFWALDPDINQFNIDSYQARALIVDVLTGIIFQNSLISETNLIFEGINQIVFSRITYLGPKGEVSPIVHQSILRGVARILSLHFNEIVRIRNVKLEKLTKIKLIKEIQKSKGKMGSLAFSAEVKHSEYRNKFPLPKTQAALLWEILSHYRYSAWPESRERAESLIKDFYLKLGFDPQELFA